MAQAEHLRRALPRAPPIVSRSNHGFVKDGADRVWWNAWERWGVVDPAGERAIRGFQLFSMRPLPGFADYRTPVRGLYLCGAAAHPGGGVMGACGWNAAGEMLRDARRGR